MRQATAALSLLVLAITLAPLAYAGETAESTETTTPTEAPATAVPGTPLPYDPTDGAIPVSEFMGCPYEDVGGTGYSDDVGEQTCIDFCTSNGWTYLAYGPGDRGSYLCFCCTS